MITHQQNTTCNKIAVKKNLQLFIKKSLVVFGLTSLIIGGISGFSSIASINNIKSQAASPSYTTSNKKFFRDGQEIVLKGVNWFGFETDNAVFHGLWTNRSANTQLDQMKSLGFNAIRVPVCPGVLTNKAIGGVDYSANPDLNGLNSQQALDLLMNKISAKGMYILLDHHRPDCNAISEYWYTSGYSETQWIGDLKSLATRYASNPNFVGIDIKNEPHGPVSWSEWKGATERAGQAILGVNPNIVIYTEGVSSTNAGGNCNSSYNAWWGGNIKGQLCDPISTAAIPANKLAFAPHVYGPDVYAQPYFNDTTFANMPAIWDDHFGSVQAAGNSVAFGEFGGKYGGGDPRDVAWQNKIVDYQIAKGMCSFFFWSWNPNSGDTGGILNDDWTTVSTAKYNNLKRLMDAPACQGGSVPSNSSSPASSIASSAANSVSSSPNSSSAGVSSSVSSSTPANSACYQVMTNRQMGGDNWYN
ncbi:MAG: glycoside hydrolase family 5 protein, partial [Candidatus Parcubacteria bacterium]|nr:glycoside hydrolase family 5 protein [Candidatus Paceibacterota bacterium]